MPTREREALLAELEFLIVETGAELACAEAGREPAGGIAYPASRLRLTLAALWSYRDQILVGPPREDDRPA